ncbi:MAG: hypothetical protein RLZZ399_491 [Verrucomicrobiota bacterium]
MIGVVIPTRNCRAYLERHVAGLSQWIDLAEEVVVVDSHSTDGTVEFLRDQLKHPNLRFLTHPPGLYASWNFGISQIRAKYTAIATCGDTLSREGLESLLKGMELLGCDVLISKPVFEDLEGRSVPGPRWTVDEVVARLGLQSPHRLSAFQSLAFISSDLTSAFTGSCASCLFRTEMLQQRPFPTDVGASGDGVWALRNALQISWGVTPGVFSTFLKHPMDSGSSDRQPPKDWQLRLDRFLSESVSDAVTAGIVSEEELEARGWREMEKALAQYCLGKAQFDRARKQRFPWFLRPSAWRSRFQRTSARARVRRLQEGMLAEVSV